MFELNKENTKKIMKIAITIILICFVLFNYNGAMKVLSFILTVLNPLIYGFAICYLLNIIVVRIENRSKIKSKKNKSKPIKRGWSIFFAILFIVAIILLTIGLIIPQIINSAQVFAKNLPSIIEICKGWLEGILKNNPDLLEQVQNFNPNVDEITSNVTNFLQENANGIIGNSVNVISNVFTQIVNFGLGCVFAVYFVAKKEYFISEIKKNLKAHKSKEKYEKIVHIGNVANDKFQNYFVGQFIDGIIIGFFTFIIMLICGVPYSLALGVLVGALSLIPSVGVIMGLIFGALLIVVISPIKALIFMIIVIVVWQIDENFIKPEITKRKLKISDLVIFFAVIIGGTNFGMLGLILAVPFVATIYELYQEYSKTLVD